MCKVWSFFTKGMSAGGIVVCAGPRYYGGFEKCHFRDTALYAVHGAHVTLCRTEQAREIAARLCDGYRDQFGITPQIFASRPSQGAHLVH